MTIITTILLLIAITGLLFLLGLGIAIALGVFVVGGVFLALYFLFFGHGFIWSGLGINNQVRALPQQFNQCLLKEDPELCRTKYTVWQPEEAEIIQQLAKQVREDLGARADDAEPGQYAQTTVNGKTSITMDEQTSFAKKAAVREHYVFIQEGKDKPLKIKELKWDYGEPAPAETVGPNNP